MKINERKKYIPKTERKIFDQLIHKAYHLSDISLELSNAQTGYVNKCRVLFTQKNEKVVLRNIPQDQDVDLSYTSFKDITKDGCDYLKKHRHKNTHQIQ